jgi:hypothetical protein
MEKRAVNKSTFESLYAFLLLAYPAEFRRKYGPQMSQLVRDCKRDQTGRLAGTRLCLRTLLDLARTAPSEHLDQLRKERSMNSRRIDFVALIGVVLIIATAFLLLNYGRNHQVSPILTLGYVLDAVVAAGVIGNLIVFLLTRFTRLNPLRSAFWTFLVVNGLPALVLGIIGPRIDSNFNLANTLIGYAASFVFWYGLHWLWSQRSKPAAV